MIVSAAITSVLLVALGSIALVAFLVAIVAGIRGTQTATRTASSEQVMRAEMDRLCPHGWKAEMTLYGSLAESVLPPGPESSPSHGEVVMLDWTELNDGPLGEAKAAITRRVWGATVPEALAAMVEDRRTDATLEEIERNAARS